jgi:hypothetical protein
VTNTNGDSNPRRGTVGANGTQIPPFSGDRQAAFFMI